VEIFPQIDANSNGEISQIEIVKALNKDSALAKRLGLPNDIRQEDESRKLFALKYADIDKDQNKGKKMSGDFAAYYQKDDDGDMPRTLAAGSMDSVYRSGKETATVIAEIEALLQKDVLKQQLKQGLCIEQCIHECAKEMRRRKKAEASNDQLRARVEELEGELSESRVLEAPPTGLFHFPILFFGVAACSDEVGQNQGSR